MRGPKKPYGTIEERAGYRVPARPARMLCSSSKVAKRTSPTEEGLHEHDTTERPSDPAQPARALLPCRPTLANRAKPSRALRGRDPGLGLQAHPCDGPALGRPKAPAEAPCPRHRHSAP